MREIQTTIRELIDESRSLTFDLSSPLLYQFGLEAAVEKLVEQVGIKYGIQLDFKNDEQPKPLDHDTSVILFQIVRELLTNVVKHAQAHNASVCLKRDNENIYIIVEDNGVGFDTSELYSVRSRGFGLFSIRERLSHIGGQLEIESKLAKGTRMTVSMSLKQV